MGRGTEAISKSFAKYLGNVQGKREIKELQKTAYIGHSTHSSQSANVKVQNIQHGK
jgi:hypothetical protein